MVSNLCSEAGKGLQQCSQGNKSKAFCTKQSKDLLSCRKNKNKKDEDGESYEFGTWYPLETEGYYISFDETGYFIRDPETMIFFVEDSSETYDDFIHPATGESLGIIKQNETTTTSSCSCQK